LWLKSTQPEGAGRRTKLMWVKCRVMWGGSMSDITPKVFRIRGRIRKPNLKTHFSKEVVALKPEDAVEKIFAEFGSKHRAKRFQIQIIDVEEITPEEVTDLTLRKMLGVA